MRSRGLVKALEEIDWISCMIMFFFFFFFLWMTDSQRNVLLVSFVFLLFVFVSAICFFSFFHLQLGCASLPSFLPSCTMIPWDLHEFCSILFICSFTHSGGWEDNRNPCSPVDYWHQPFVYVYPITQKVRCTKIVRRRFCRVREYFQRTRRVLSCCHTAGMLPGCCSEGGGWGRRGHVWYVASSRYVRSRRLGL